MFSSTENGLEYSLEIVESLEEITISYIELGLLVMAILLTVIFGIKPSKSKA